MKKNINHLHSIKELINSLKTPGFVYIQPHDFPDCDAIASSFGLKYLFSLYGIESEIIYAGELERESLNRFIRETEIPVTHIDDIAMKEHDKIVIVDGCKGLKNVTDFIGDEVGVIDHHRVNKPEDVEFVDVRREYGACSTMIAMYYHELGIEIPSNIASALLLGINVDTALLTREVNEKDLEMFLSCYKRADVVYVNSLLRNKIEKADLDYYKHLIENLEFYNSFAFCYFPEGCTQNLLGILADFVLSLNEADFVFLCAKNSAVINISVRNEMPGKDASLIVRKTLDGIGFGGGHTNMAGGLIYDPSSFNKELIIDRVISALK